MRHTFLLDRVVVHAARVIVADLLRIRVAPTAGRRRSLKNLVQHLPVILFEIVELVGIRRIVGDGMQLAPVTAGITVKVNTGIAAVSIRSLSRLGINWKVCGAVSLAGVEPVCASTLLLATLMPANTMR